MLSPPLGIIPAYAGSTKMRDSSQIRHEDHPRIRGEHRLFTEYERRGGGSSPHTRGALAGVLGGARLRRIIPAYAGSTQRAPVCARHHVGSSPHTRGALTDPIDALEDAGIIPAYAGSTAQRIAVDGAPADHPRIRGEHLAPPRHEGRVLGSSPHTRGAPCSPPATATPKRIIPAYAGSTPPTPKPF